MKSSNPITQVKLKLRLLSLLLSIFLTFLLFFSAARSKTAVASTAGGIAQDKFHPGVTLSDAEMVITAVYTDFNPNNIQAFQLNGDSALISDTLQVNPVAPSASVSAWWSRPVYLGANRSFRTYL